MKMKRIFAALAAGAVAAGSMTAVSAWAAEVSYQGPSEGVYYVDSEDNTIRLNIVNETETETLADIDKNTDCEAYVAVTFTVDGIGNNAYNKKEDGTRGEAYQATLLGSIGPNVFKGEPEEDTVTAGTVGIIGEGCYQVRTPLPQAADSISYLALKLNIDVHNYDDNGDLDKSGVEVSVDKVEIGDESDVTTTVLTTLPITTTAIAATAGKTTTNTQTGDIHVAAVVLSAVAAASLGVGAYTVTRRKQK